MRVPKRNCHPDRSEAKWRDLRLTHPASNTNGSAALPLSSRVDMGPCAGTEGDETPSAYQPFLMETSPYPLSSRAQPRDLQFAPPTTRCTWKGPTQPLSSRSVRPY